MSLQYITDDRGQTTGVFIPIHEWNDIKSKYQDIEQDIPDWHKKMIDQRMEDHKNNPEHTLDFDQAMDDIEESL